MYNICMSRGAECSYLVTEYKIIEPTFFKESKPREQSQVTERVNKCVGQAVSAT